MMPSIQLNVKNTIVSALSRQLLCVHKVKLSTSTSLRVFPNKVIVPPLVTQIKLCQDSIFEEASQ